MTREEMREHKATPGPWEVEDVRANYVYAARTGAHYAIDGKDFRPALILGDGTENRGVAEANARLIAAAPDLLEACNKLLAAANCHYHWRVILSEYGEMARAAIAKAEGGQV